MKLKRYSCLIKPNKDIWWMTTHVGPSYVKQITDELLEIYITGRSDDNKSRIGIAKVKIHSDHTLECVNIDRNPIFDVGETGLFDEAGVSYPWLINDDTDEYMFYVGWSRSSETGFQNFLGVARRRLNACRPEFDRVFNVPVLDRCHDEPFGTGSCCISRQGDRWVMLYTSFLDWENKNKISKYHKNMQPSYLLKVALSKDLLNWERTGQTPIKFEGEEHIIGKPMYMFSSKSQDAELWFSVRGEAYKIGYASGKDIYNLKRLAMNNLILDPPPSIGDWDYETQEYAFVIDVNCKKLVFYNGNEYGKTGLGYGEWVYE